MFTVKESLGSVFINCLSDGIFGEDMSNLMLIEVAFVNKPLVANRAGIGPISCVLYLVCAQVIHSSCRMGTVLTGVPFKDKSFI